MDPVAMEQSFMWLKFIRNLTILIFIINVFSSFAQMPLPQDSLTMALCKNDEQIVSRRTNEWRIDYYMGETQLNMKTMCGFLDLNGASKPIYASYRFQKNAGWVLFLGGIGMIIADGRISRPKSPVITLCGVAVSVSGIVTGYKSNEKFRRAIRAYNRDICNLK
jgi:hypothetical protein